jgi:hypothetical protein
MKQVNGIFLACLVILVSLLVITGCSDQSAESGAAATPTGTPVPTTAAGPKYSAGDVVGSASTTNQAWLILSYDSATDKYTRAAIYMNTDGSWGHRIDSSTETADRKVVDKVYINRLAQLSVSSVPVRTPTTPPTTVATTAPTATPYPAPVIRSITPDYGTANQTVSVEISGLNFRTGAIVNLKQTGKSPVNATNVNVASTSLITCSFTLPDVPSGFWDLVVTNSDGQYDTDANTFTIHEVVETT